MSRINGTSSARSAARRAAGFTFIELILVIVIVGILSAIAGPRYAQATANYRAEMAARRVAEDIKTAQTRARSLSKSQTIAFNTANQSYVLAGVSDWEHRSNANYTVDLTDAPYRATIAMALTAGKTTITFDAYGVPDASGTITLTSGNATKKVVVTDSSTLGVKIQ